MAKKEEIRERYSAERVLENWRELRQALPNMNEVEVEEALRVEASRGKEKRRDFISQLHGKFTRLRAAREREELME